MICENMIYFGAQNNGCAGWGAVARGTIIYIIIRYRGSRIHIHFEHQQAEHLRTRARVTGWLAPLVGEAVERRRDNDIVNVSVS
jgi:hypothetical protein